MKLSFPLTGSHVDFAGRCHEVKDGEESGVASSMNGILAGAFIYFSNPLWGRLSHLTTIFGKGLNRKQEDGFSEFEGLFWVLLWLW